MSEFDELSGVLTDTCLEQFGDDAWFYPPDGSDRIRTSAVYTPSTDVIGDMGQVMDPRPTVDLKMADVGKPKGGEVELRGRRYKLDRLVHEDGEFATYFVQDRGAA